MKIWRVTVRHLNSDTVLIDELFSSRGRGLDRWRDAVSEYGLQECKTEEGHLDNMIIRSNLAFSLVLEPVEVK